MRSSFLGLEVSKRSIQISQKALDITSNNLNNITTEGYTRQRVDTSSLHLGSYNNWQTRIAKLSLAGQGVNALGVAQVRDSYIDKRYREQTCYVAQYDTKSSILTELETVLDNIDNTGLTNAMDNFKQALNSYAEQPDSKELSSIVRNQALNITTMLKGYTNDLTDLKNDTLSSLQGSVEDVNTLIQKIVNYNDAIVHEYSITGAGKIYNGESVIGSYGPNELIDARNLLIDELSFYGNIHVEDNANGSVKITMGDLVIVNDQKYESLIMKDYDDYGAVNLRWTNGDSFKTMSGDINAYIDMLNGNGPYANHYQNSEYGIPYYQSSLDAFAASFASLMNSINGMDDDASRVLFSSSSDYYDDNGTLIRGKITAGTIRISEEWMNDPTMPGQVYNEKTGKWSLSLDGETVNRFIDALNTEMDIGDKNDFHGSCYEFLQFLSNRLGQNIGFLKEQYEVANNTANGLLDSRDAVSGVSDTEEGINMLTYQKWFNASSRMMTAMDECLDRIINNMGIVGT